MRVLHLVKTSVGATWAYRQMRELARLGVEVHVALPPGGPLVPRYEIEGIVVHPLQADFPVRSPWHCPGTLRMLRDLVARIRPDILHSHFVGTTLTMRLALGRAHPTPRLFQVPGPLHLEHAFFRRAELATAGPSDRWIGSCRWTCDRYRRSGVSADRIYLTYYGCDLEELARTRPGKLRHELDRLSSGRPNENGDGHPAWSGTAGKDVGPGGPEAGLHPPPPDAMPGKTPIGIDVEAKLVGMVAYMYAPKRYLGQVRGIKGHEDLIDALALCAKAVPNLLGVFIGGAWADAQAYEKRIQSYGRKKLGDRVLFLGTRDDVADLYPDLDVVVHPSHSENVGGAAESLLLAVPTIATAVGGLPDFVEPGVTGWLVPPRDPARLADAILDALSHPDRAREMAVRGQSRARERLDVKINARELLGIYGKVLA